VTVSWMSPATLNLTTNSRTSSRKPTPIVTTVNDMRDALWKRRMKPNSTAPPSSAPPMITIGTTRA
jgi:hypothetical protein